METKKLYYEKSHLREFTAVVVSCTQTEKGFEIFLDQTAFYPEGGGQACDLGSLSDANVLDVRERGEQVCHLCDKALAVGQTVTGRIDWQRRFDLMQQHTGEHILSGLIHSRFGYQNSGFHVGAQVMEVDFDGPIPPEALAELEHHANQVIWENLPVNCWYPTQEELPTIPYRTKRQLPWPVRIVQIPNVDTCACCGVHVKYTGEVGLIKILSCVKFHSGVRLEMVCGNRAYQYVRDIFDQNRLVSQLLSAKMPETAQAVQKLLDGYNAEKFRVTGLEKQVFDAIAQGYAGRENVVHFADGLTGGGVRELAEGIGKVCSGVAAVFSGDDEKGYQLCLVSGSVDVRELGKKLTDTLSGRGGGKPCAFQGSVKASKNQIAAFFGE